MKFENTQDEYGLISKILHWGMALLIFGLVLAGFFMEGLSDSLDKFKLYGLHKSFGLIVFIFVIFRLLWRFISMAPDPLETQTPWENFIAKIVQVLLYLFMLGLPLSGVLMSNSGGYPVGFFGVEVPALIGKDKAVFEASKEAHELFAFGLLGVLGVHIVGAFKHHFLDKEITMERIMFSNSPKLALIIFGVTALFFIGAGYLLLGKKEAVENVLQESGVEVQAVDMSVLGEHDWVIIPEKSTLKFQATMNGVSFTGHFEKFEGNIIFNPDDLKGSKAFVRIDMSSAVTQNKERDVQLMSEDWFNIELYPQAEFETIVIEKAHSNNYIAVGSLSIRGVKLPVTLPFTLDIEVEKDGTKRAKMEGMLELSRLDFGIGQGEWADGKSVDTSVKVHISLRVLQPAR